MGFKDVLKTAFPFLVAAASAVPGGQIATTALGKILKLDPGATLDDAGAALLNAPPEVRAQLQAEENRHKEVMAQMGINSIQEYERIMAGDRASAREREMTLKDKIPAILAIGITLGFFGLLFIMLKFPPPPASEKVMDIMLGALTTAWIAVVTYYFGSSAGSARKTELLSQQTN
jgi:hypothetical protein